MSCTPPCAADCALCAAYRRILDRVRERAATMQPVRMHVRRPSFDFEPSFVYAPYVPFGLIPYIDAEPDSTVKLTLLKPRTFDATPIKSLWDVHDGITTAPYDSPDPQLDVICEEHDRHFWPHKNGCPACGHDAYVGFAIVECCNTHCRNHVWREGM